MFGSYVINDLCLVLFPVAYVSAERLESSEQRSNNQVVVYRAGSLRRRPRAVAVGCLGRRGLYDTMRSAIYAAELLGSPVTMRCA